MKNKKFDDYEDDGRTIVDMSQVERPNLFTFRRKDEDQEVSRPMSSTVQEEYTSEQRRWAIFGALKASLLIGSAYVVGLGLLILILVIWFLH